MKAIIVNLLLAMLIASKAFGAGDLVVTGNIGAGTTNPRAKLEVSGTALARYSVSLAAYVDLAKGLTPTITSGTLYGGGPCYRGDNSHWLVKAFPASMTVDLGPSSSNIYNLQYITFGTHWKEDARWVPYDYVLEHSNDGISWAAITTVTANTERHLVHLVSVSSRYIRLTINAPQPGKDTVVVAGLQLLSNIHGELARKEPWAVTGDNASIAIAGNVGIGTAGTPTAKLEVNGGIRLNSTAAKPVCNDATRGTFWVTRSPAGVKDAVEVCAKDQADAYAWRIIW